MTRPIPLSGLMHRGVALFEQSERAMAKARRDIDRVSAMVSTDALEAVCKDRSWAAEARLLAEAMLRAKWEESADAGSVRPSVDLEEIAAHTGHLGTSWHSILEPPDDNHDDDE